MIKSRRLRWADHVARMEEGRSVCMTCSLYRNIQKNSYSKLAIYLSRVRPGLSIKSRHSQITICHCIELRKKLVMCYVWNIVLYGSDTWTLRKLERKYLESFEMWCWRRMEMIKDQRKKFLKWMNK